MSYKIFHFVSSLNVGGAERFALDLSVIQKQMGHEVVVLSAGDEDDLLVEEAEKIEIPTKIIHSGRIHFYSQLIFLLKERSSKKEKILHIHSPSILLYIAPILLILKYYRVKIIYTRHGCDPLARFKWYLSHRWGRYFVSLTTFVSQAGLDVFHKNHHWPKSSLRMIKNGVLVPENVSVLNKGAGQEIKKLRLGSVGRLVPLKSQQHLLEAVSKLACDKQGQIEVHIYGDGPDRVMLENFANQSIVYAEVYFHGMVLDRERIFSSIDMLVMCSETEGLSMSIMEAMARKKPVIATDVGDSGKLVLPEMTGKLYDYGDIEKLSNLIDHYVTNIKDREEQGRRAQEHIKDNYSILETAKLYDQCYKL